MSSAGSFTVKGAGLSEFNGVYLPDGSMHDARIYHARGYRKNGKDKQTMHRTWERGYLNTSELHWVLGEEHSGSWYKQASTSDLPPTGAWSTVGAKGKGPAPTLTANGGAAQASFGVRVGGKGCLSVRRRGA